MYLDACFNSFTDQVSPMMILFYFSCNTLQTGIALRHYLVDCINLQKTPQDGAKCYSCCSREASFSAFLLLCCFGCKFYFLITIVAITCIYL